MSDRRKAVAVLTMNTLAFTVCFAVWMMNGVLVTFLVGKGIFAFDKIQIGWLCGIPVLTGSLTRLPVGILTDRYGGRVVFPGVMVLSAIAALGVSFATSYAGFVVGSLGFGLAGAGFAVGIAYTSLWFPKERQGTALGVFGVGNAGAALTSIGGPLLLRRLTAGGENLEGWRNMPRIYAGALLAMTLVFVVFTHSRKVERPSGTTLATQLATLRSVRVWRFGLYYFLVFGCFVGLAQWLVPYYVGAYGTTLATAGVLASIFSLPSGVVRALGGWMSDKLGARKTMVWVLACCTAGCLVLALPMTRLVPQTNIWVFTAVLFVVGFAMGVGKAAVYKYIPDYFPAQVGVVGGLVGVIGGLGGFVCPILFGYLLRSTGLWASSWVFLFALSLVCTVWLGIVVKSAVRARNAGAHPNIGAIVSGMGPGEHGA